MKVAGDHIHSSRGNLQPRLLMIALEFPNIVFNSEISVLLLLT